MRKERAHFRKDEQASVRLFNCSYEKMVIGVVNLCLVGDREIACAADHAFGEGMDVADRQERTGE